MIDEQKNEVETIDISQLSSDTENEQNVTTTEFVDEENYNAFRLLGLKSKVNDINSMMENINEKQNELFEMLNTINNELKSLKGEK